ncbi:hypothetical protein MCAP1_001805 [Malassezia caprae]|uniref:Uncharacterized protein n=1 Tax=Malassezia caprae TaxID=1381934 RepID=A0AAF0E774_9BASI|nr:hypothetical protein MCAP1_001805 [Malassezia caprae]
MPSGASWVASRDLPARIRGTPVAELEEAIETMERAYALDEPSEEWIWESSVEPAPVDAFEAQYVRAWLDRLIQHACAHSEAAHLMDPAAALLVHLAGQAAGGARERLYRFFLHPHEAPRCGSEAAAAVRIRDATLTEDALGVRTWGAAPYLARRLLQQYTNTAARPTHILELGAGTGLVGLALAQGLTAQRSNVHVTLTDHHAAVLDNLAHNAAVNAVHGVEVRRLDWQKLYEARGQAQGDYRTTAQTLPIHNDERAAAYGSVPPEARYELIVAADCIYDPQHAAWIEAVVLQHLAPRSDSFRPQLQLLMPMRSTHQAELQSVYETFCTARGWAMVSQHTLDGIDNFGPAELRQSDGSTRSGSFVAYRHMIIEPL